MCSTSSRGLFAVSGNMKKTWMNMAAQNTAKSTYVFQVMFTNAGGTK